MLEEVDHGSMRYRWKKNELEIAEIVADAFCFELMRKNIEANPADYANADWDLYYAEFSEHMTKFLPTVHALVIPIT